MTLDFHKNKAFSLIAISNLGTSNIKYGMDMLISENV